MVRIPRRRYSDAEAHDAEAFFAELMGESTPPTTPPCCMIWAFETPP